MIRGERRGCVKLKNAQMGINDEDDSTFTITVDSKVFHFQGKQCPRLIRFNVMSRHFMRNFLTQGKLTCSALANIPAIHLPR